jgi:hypothetical protein
MQAPSRVAQVTTFHAAWVDPTVAMKSIETPIHWPVEHTTTSPFRGGSLHIQHKYIAHRDVDSRNIAHRNVYPKNIVRRNVDRGRSRRVNTKARARATRSESDESCTQNATVIHGRIGRYQTQQVKFGGWVQPLVSRTQPSTTFPRSILVQEFLYRAVVVPGITKHSLVLPVTLR